MKYYSSYFKVRLKEIRELAQYQYTYIYYSQTLFLLIHLPAKVYLEPQISTCGTFSVFQGHVQSDEKI